MVSYRLNPPYQGSANVRYYRTAYRKPRVRYYQESGIPRSGIRYNRTFVDPWSIPQKQEKQQIEKIILSHRSGLASKNIFVRPVDFSDFFSTKTRVGTESDEDSDFKSDKEEPTWGISSQYCNREFHKKHPVTRIGYE